MFPMFFLNGRAAAANPLPPSASANGGCATHSPAARPPLAEPQQLIEIVSPRTNASTILPAENLLAAVSLPEPFALEIAATRTLRWFVARANSGAMRQHIENQLAVAYPQAAISPVDTTRPGFDPARRLPDEQAAACTLVLARPECLPLRTFGDADLAAERSAHAAQADPVLGILGALGDLPDGWRALAQLVLRPAPDDWCRPYRRLALEHPLAAERAAQASAQARPGTGPAMPLLAALMFVAIAGYQVFQWWEAGEWPKVVLAAAALGVGVPALVWGVARVRRLLAPDLIDPNLVIEKIRGVGFTAQLRLAVFAPREVPEAEVRARLDRIAAAYRQFGLASGNWLRPVPLRLTDRHGVQTRDLRTLALLPPAGAAPVLNARELAGLWHLPQELADVPLVERTTERRWLPLPHTVARGCRIGGSDHQGHSVPVHVPEALLRRHLLLVAKTRRGKSSLMLRLARHLMDDPHRALVLVDPHQDLAWGALGLVPPARRDGVVYLDVADDERPFGLNLIDTGLRWDRDKAISNALLLFRREFDRFWGPRMEDAFRFALLTLYEANEALCREDPVHGRDRQYTILDVPAVLADVAFRRTVVPLVKDPAVHAWWAGYFERLDRRLQVEILNPVATKVQRFAASRAARGIVGQPRSTIDPAAWLRESKIVIVNTAKGEVGEDTAALLGGCLLNLAALVVGEQAALPAAERRPVTLLVDEFHSMPGADYESVLAELAKYGANLVLATQSLTRLEAVDREQQRGLRATVFSNLDGLFAFHTSAEDARYLIRELGGGVDERDLVELGEHRCYAKWSDGGERLPVFSLTLDPPPPADDTLAEHLATTSAALYGRAREVVERALRQALARIEAARQGNTTPTTQEEAADGGDHAGRTSHAAPDKPAGKPRNWGRPRKPADPTLHQAALFNTGGTDGTAGDAEPSDPASSAGSGAGDDDDPGRPLGEGELNGEQAA